MRIFAQLLLVICVTVVLTGAARVEAQEIETSYTFEFESEFGQSEATFDRRVRRLRSFGWSFFGFSSVVLATVPLFHDVGDLPGFAAPFYWGLSAAAHLTISGALLLRARALVVRRRRFRAQQAALDRSYFHPEVDIGITPGGLSLHLSF